MLFSILRQKAMERRRNSLPTELQNRLDGIRKHLRRANLEADIGKTGDSITGQVSEKDKKVATIQTEHAKEYILRRRKQKDIL